MVDTPGAIFARRLREERTRRGLSQAELARLLSERLGVTVDGSAVTRIEKGERAVRLDEAVAITEVLGVRLDALLDGPSTEELELEELRHDLAEAQWRAEQARATREEALGAAVAIQRQIDRVERTIERARSERVDEQE